MTNYIIEDLERGTLLMNHNGWKIAEFIGQSAQPNKYTVITHDLKSGQVRRTLLTAIQLQQRYPRLHAWTNPFCGNAR
jgi:hypothetical protein